jgi:single-stranded-DNA-specific exonuclease
MWKVLDKLKDQRTKKPRNQEIVDVLLRNRGLRMKKQKEEFFNPTPAENLSLKELGIDSKQIGKAIRRIKLAKKKKEKVIVYGDYDADGICATAILWETLHALGVDALPYIPERFSEGYGLNAESIQKIKDQNSKIKLIITVDNGIIAKEAIRESKKMGIDVIITDHHEKGERYPKAYAVIHTTKIGGAGVSWILSRELRRKFETRSMKSEKGSKILKLQYNSIRGKQVQNDRLWGLDLCAIGTIADQIPLIGPNRSFVKYGLEELNITNRPGLLELFREASVEKGSIKTYEVGFIIAPRLNAMGRLYHAIESLRLICTRSRSRAKGLALHLGKVNKERQKIVEEVLLHAQKQAKKKKWDGVVVVSDKSYHEGVIGLAAAKLVGEYYRPAIVFSEDREVSKASARSISGFNIIEAIRKLEHLHLGGGGHPMAAGFSINTADIGKFGKELGKLSKKLLTKDVLQKKVNIDLELNINNLDWELLKQLKRFEPFGLGNPMPTFVARKLHVVDARTVGREGKHLKLKLKSNGVVFDAIAFGMGDLFVKLSTGKKVDVVYTFEENVWNGNRSLQLKIKDIKMWN